MDVMNLKGAGKVYMCILVYGFEKGNRINEFSSPLGVPCCFEYRSGVGIFMPYSPWWNPSSNLHDSSLWARLLSTFKMKTMNCTPLSERMNFMLVFFPVIYLVAYSRTLLRRVRMKCFSGCEFSVSVHSTLSLNQRSFLSLTSSWPVK